MLLCFIQYEDAQTPKWQFFLVRKTQISGPRVKLRGQIQVEVGGNWANTRIHVSL